MNFYKPTARNKNHGISPIKQGEWRWEWKEFELLSVCGWWILLAQAQKMLINVFGMFYVVDERFSCPDHEDLKQHCQQIQTYILAVNTVKLKPQN